MAATTPAGATTLRRATAADADTLSTLARRCFTETFGHLYPAEDLAAFLDTAYAVDRHRALLADPTCAAWLLERAGGDAVGYALAGACSLPHPDVRTGDGELKRLYLLREAQGGGDGGRVFDAVQRWLERDGPRTLWLGVWSQNVGAQRFYARRGFTRVGDYLFPVGRVRDLEYILRRPPSLPASQ